MKLLQLWAIVLVTTLGFSSNSMAAQTCAVDTTAVIIDNDVSTNCEEITTSSLSSLTSLTFDGSGANHRSITISGSGSNSTGINISGSADGDYSLTVSGALTTTASIGDIDSRLQDLYVTGSVTTASDVYTIGASITGTVVFNGNSATSTTGTWSASKTPTTGAAYNYGTMIYSGGSFYFNGGETMSGSTTVHYGGLLSMGTNVTHNGSITLGGTLDLGTSSLTISGTTGTFTSSGNQAIIQTTINSNTDYGQLWLANGVAPTITDASVVINIAGTVNHNEIYYIANAWAGTGVSTMSASATDNSYVFDFYQIQSTGTNRNLAYRAVQTSSLSSLITSAGGNGVVLGTILDSFFNTTDATQRDLVNIFNFATSADDFKRVINQVMPETNAGSVLAGVNAGAQTFGAISNRIAEVQTQGKGELGNHYAVLRNKFDRLDGRSGGDPSKMWGSWIRLFGNYTNQDKRDGVDGWESNSYGGALGLDRLFMDNKLLLGLSYSYAVSHVDGKGDRADNEVDVKNHAVNVYGGYQKGKHYFDGMIGIGFNTYDTERHVVSGSAHRVANANYDGRQFGVKAGWAYDLMWGNNVFTPLVALNYTHIANDNYSETGGVGINLSVDETSFNYLQTSWGARLTFPFWKTTNTTITPEIHARLLWEVLGERQKTTSTFLAGGSSFTAEGPDPSQFGGNFGTSFKWEWDDYSLHAAYDAEIRDAYNSHSLSAKFRYEF